MAMRFHTTHFLFIRCLFLFGPTVTVPDTRLDTLDGPDTLDGRGIRHGRTRARLPSPEVRSSHGMAFRGPQRFRI